MQVMQNESDSKPYAKCIEVSRRVHWEIDRDVIRGRRFDFSKKFLPDAISRINELEFLSDDEKRFLSQVQGRTYANMFGLVERFIGAKILQVAGEYGMGDQTKLEALVRFTDEELKHQELFRRIEQLTAAEMPEGYVFVPQPNEVAAFVLGKSTWAVLALTCLIELFTQSHYRQSIEPERDLSELYKDVFLYHWREESQHAIVDELEWRRENTRLSAGERDLAVDDLIDLVGGVDGLLQLQADADAAYVLRSCRQSFAPGETQQLRAGVLKAYRWQYIVSGVENPRFAGILGDLITPEQSGRISTALAPMVS